MQFTYNNDFKAYFRFQNTGNKFKKDEFVDREWYSFKNEPEIETEYIGVDIIPNDVCPINKNVTSMLQFNDLNKVKT